MNRGGHGHFVADRGRICVVVKQRLFQIGPPHIGPGSLRASEIMLCLLEVIVAQAVAEYRHPVLNTGIVGECMAAAQKIVRTLNPVLICHSLNGIIDSVQFPRSFRSCLDIRILQRIDPLCNRFPL